MNTSLNKLSCIWRKVMELPFTCIRDLSINAMPYVLFDNPCNIGFEGTYSFFGDSMLEVGKYSTVICVGGASLCLSMAAVVWMKWTRKRVLCLEMSPCCSLLFENFFHSACPWYRYELQWIQKHTSVSFSPPLLVVFRSTSSLKYEIDATLENVTYTDNIMLIVMHNCEPTLRPTKLLRSCEDKRVVSFTNILTWNGSIYHCSINEKAKNDIKLYLSSKAQLTMA